MKRVTPAALLLGTCGVSLIAVVGAQRGGGEWTTSGFDAQRTAWVRADTRLTKDAVRKGEFKFLWKAKFENEARQLNSLTQPILLDLLIGYRGFKTLAFIGGSADRVFSIDTDLARPYWTTHLNYSVATGGQPPTSWPCPGGLIATPSRRTAFAPAAGRGGGGGGRRGGTGSAVGAPGRGAAVLSQQPPPGRGAAPAATPAPPTPPAGAPPAAPPAQPGPGRGGGGIAAPAGFGGVDLLFVVGSDGLLHALRVSNGADAIPPVPFLPPHAKPSSLIVVDGVVYTTTSDGCGAVPNAVWALDLLAPESKVATWKSGGANVAGTAGPALGTDGTLYVAVGSGSAQGTRTPTTMNGPGAEVSYSNAVVALDRKTLQPKDWFSSPGVDFNASPIVIRYKDKDLIAATANDGRLYLLDSASLGGSDHATPLFVTPKYTATGAGAALATWEDQDTRWILASATGAAPAGVKFTSNGLAPIGRVVSFKLVDQSGRLTLEPGWSSRDLRSPLAPIVVNGMALVVSSGEYRSANAQLTAAERAQRSTPAILYVLDGTTGKELWTSGPKTITSFARAGLSAGGGQVYLVTYDNHLYAFGIPMEH
jgi:putative pyrroloquinoline-quinone-binding quinoprotein